MNELPHIEVMGNEIQETYLRVAFVSPFRKASLLTS